MLSHTIINVNCSKIACWPRRWQRGHDIELVNTILADVGRTWIPLPYFITKYICQNTFVQGNRAARPVTYSDVLRENVWLMKTSLNFHCSMRRVQLVWELSNPCVKYMKKKKFRLFVNGKNGRYTYIFYQLIHVHYTLRPAAPRPAAQWDVIIGRFPYNIAYHMHMNRTNTLAKSRRQHNWIYALL